MAKAGQGTGAGGNVTVTTGQSSGGSVTIGSGVSTGQSGGITLTGQSGGKITFAGASLQDAYAGTADNWATMAGSGDMDQLRYELHDLQQTMKLLMRQNQRLYDEIEALKAGVILDPPDLA